MQKQKLSIHLGALTRDDVPSCVTSRLGRSDLIYHLTYQARLATDVYQQCGTFCGTIYNRTII